MRSRQEIEEGYKELIVPSESTEAYKLLFELLMDIRDLLSSQREDDLREKIENARKRIEEERAKKIEETVKRIG